MLREVILIVLCNTLPGGLLEQAAGWAVLDSWACWVVSAEADDSERLLLLLTRHAVVLLFKWRLIMNQ